MLVVYLSARAIVTGLILALQSTGIGFTWCAEMLIHLQKLLTKKIERCQRG